MILTWSLIDVDDVLWLTWGPWGSEEIYNARVPRLREYRLSDNY